MTEFLCKPVSATALLQRIQSIVLNPRPFVRNGRYFGPEIRQPLAAGTKSGMQLARGEVDESAARAAAKENPVPDGKEAGGTEEQDAVFEV